MQGLFRVSTTLFRRCLSGRYRIFFEEMFGGVTMDEWEGILRPLLICPFGLAFGLNEAQIVIRDVLCFFLDFLGILYVYAYAPLILDHFYGAESLTMSGMLFLFCS